MKYTRRMVVALMVLLVGGIFSVATAQDEFCEDSVFAEVIGDTAIVYHNGAWYNCCAEIEYTLVEEGSTLHLIETETFPIGPCYCMCCFDLSVTIFGLEPDVYLIKVWNEDQSVLYGEVEVIVGDSLLGEMYQSDCYKAISTGDLWEKEFEECEDSVFVEGGVHQVAVYHTGAWYNCCAEMKYALQQEGDTLNIVEIETFPWGPCDCMCCFDLSVIIANLEQGLYLVRVWDEQQSILYGEAWAIVTGSGKGGNLGPVYQSECYNSVTAPENGEAGLEMPRYFALSQNCPNPFNPSTEIRYALPMDCWVRLEIFNLLGHRVATLVDEPQAAGHRRVAWEASGLAGGIYFCRLHAGDKSQLRRMILLK